ncbi:protein LTV1 homolog [Babylonia areolata]|uniref:protein LTV1 homolog n=1 Tax=Babylonia areolata TaxID=304850 RepID=UPI003FD40420
MPGRRRKNYKSFRDVAKQGASHFEVGYRSQKDPMLADSEVSEHVLVPKEPSTREKRWEEQMQYGIYYEDDYDYLQHLRDVDEIHDSEMRQLPGFQMKEEENDDVRSVSMASTTASRLQLPSSVMGSAVERDVGLLNMAAASSGPKEDWDPDIVAALDDGFDFDDPDNALEDDFMQLANTDGDAESGEVEELCMDSGEEDGEQDDAGEHTESADGDEKHGEEQQEKAKDLSQWLHSVHLEGQGGEGEEGSEDASDDEDVDDNVSEWTDCSEDTMARDRLPRVSKYSASMVPRNENLQFIDRLTEALIEREYSWDKMGALDGEELSGRVKFDSDLFKQAYNEMMQREKKVTMKDMFDSEERIRPVVPEAWKYVEEKDYSVEEEIDYSQEPLVTAKKPQYDAQSILSTYSRTKNLPTPIVIPEEWQDKKKQKKKAKASEDSASEGTLPGLTLKDIEEQSRLERLADAPPTYRPKNETPEEKKERKQTVKAHQKERRAEKKLNKVAFKCEEQRQRKVKDAGTAQKRVVSYQS